MARRCELCRLNNAIYAWQPLGPDESPRSLQVLGSHYRGFPLIRVCGECADPISQSPLSSNSRVPSFVYKGQAYIVENEQVIKVPF